MKILIIGKGSVAQVFANRLSDGGSHVTIATKSSKFDSDSKLFSTQQLSIVKTIHKVKANSNIHLEKLANIKEKDWDIVLFCVPSDALQSELLVNVKKIADQAIIVKFQPGLLDRKYFETHFSDTKLVEGMISFLAFTFHSEETGRDLTQYWFPPLFSSRFSGSKMSVDILVATFRKAQIPVKAYSSAPHVIGQILAYELPLMVGLELSNWSISQFFSSKIFETSFLAIFEAVDITSRYFKTNRPAFFKYLTKRSIKLGTALISLIFPFDLEYYLKGHFIKVRRQSRLHLAQLIDYGKSQDLETSSLEELSNKLIR